MGSALTRAAVSRSGRVLLCSFGLTMGSFLIAVIVAEMHEGGIFEAAEEIVASSSPSVSHLSGMLTALRHLEVEVDDTVDRLAFDGRPPEDLRGVDRAHQQLLDEWKAYIRMPTESSQRALWPQVTERLGAVSGLMGRIAVLLDKRDGAGAERLMEAELKPALDEVDASVTELRGLNVQREAELARRIAVARSRSVTLAFSLGVASLILGSLSAVFALRIVRQSAALLVRRADELETFAGRVAHDIRSPLASASLAFDLLARGVGTGSPLVTTVQRGKRSIGRVVTTVDALLGFARSSAGPDPGARSEVGEVLDEVLEDLRPIADERRIEIDTTGVPPCRLACSPGLLMSVFSNLIGNALKYMGDAPVRKVAVRVRPVDGRVHLDVEDTGPGIPLTLGERIFDPFVRAPGADGAGIGLGLATVRRLVEAHGGSITVESHVGQGACFRVELPSEA